jgi:polar amino acid transport system substrate-binding protein
VSRSARTRGTRVRRAATVRSVTLVAAAGLVAGACSQTDVPESLPGPTTTTTEAPAATPPAPAGCSEDTVTQSLRPGPDATTITDASYMNEIRSRGRLRVGVDVSTLQFSSVNPFTGEFEGFDIDIAKEVATALLGSPDAIELVAIPYSERLNVLTGDNQVDMVVDTFTINCRREEEIDFSSEYFTSQQKLLVRQDDDATGIADMADRPVCAAAGSTSIDNINALPEPRPDAVPVTEQADCLVLLQQGQVDAISTDDTILAGMVAQDPNVRILPQCFSAEPYGIGLPPNRPEWVRYVNAVLEDVRASGRWDALYDRWLFDLMGVDQQPPVAVYED